MGWGPFLSLSFFLSFPVSLLQALASLAQAPLVSGTRWLSDFSGGGWRGAVTRSPGSRKLKVGAAGHPQSTAFAAKHPGTQGRGREREECPRRTERLSRVPTPSFPRVTPAAGASLRQGAL